MPIFKLQHNSNYAKIPNDTLRDKRLSIESRGVLAYLLTHSDTFSISLEFLQEELGIGRNKLKNIIRELKINGYLSLVASHNKKGNFAGQEWFVFAESQHQNFLENPFHRPTEKPSDGKPVRRENRQTENPSDNIKEKIEEQKKSLKEENKKTHTETAREEVLPGENFVFADQARPLVREVLRGMRLRLGLEVLPNEHAFAELAQWAFVNKFTAERILLCYDTLEKQRKHPVHWRKGRTTVKTIMDNLPTLDELVLETENLANGDNSNGISQTNNRGYKDAGDRAAERISNTNAFIQQLLDEGNAEIAAEQKSLSGEHSYPN